MAESKTKEETGGDETPKNKRIVTYDFKHPARVSKDQMRTLENLHSNLARMMSSSFSTFHRSMVDVDIKFVDQTTYAEFIMWLSNPSCSYTFTLEPLGGPAIIDVPMGMVKEQGLMASLVLGILTLPTGFLAVLSFALIRWPLGHREA